MKPIVKVRESRSIFRLHPPSCALPPKQVLVPGPRICFPPRSSSTSITVSNHTGTRWLWVFNGVDGWHEVGDGPVCLVGEEVLGRHDEVERAHVKLWLTSEPVLRHFLQSGIWGDAELALQRIRQRTRRYVRNSSLQRAREILDNHAHRGIPPSKARRTGRSCV